MPRLRTEHAGAQTNPLCVTDWGRLLRDEFALGYWDELTAFVEDEANLRLVTSRAAAPNERLRKPAQLGDTFIRT
jgi:hypothetical protein